MSNVIFPPLQAAKSGKLEELQKVLQNFSDDDINKSINGHDRYNYSALHHAARSGNVNTVKLLIARGAGKIMISPFILFVCLRLLMNYIKTVLFS